MIALIPARSGSKGVPNKNIKLVGGIPLFAYSILVAKMSPYVDRVIVSTDSNKYAEIARKFGAETPFIRPAEISTNTSTDLEVFLHALKWFKKTENYHPEYFLHLRPTTPLREPSVLENAIKFFLKNKEKASSLRSGHLAPESPFKWFMKDSNNYYKGLKKGLTTEKINLPRQAFPAVYIPNGYIDIIKTNTIINTGTLHGKNMLVFESPFCIEIDTVDDFKYLEYHIDKKDSIILNYYIKNK